MLLFLYSSRYNTRNLVLSLSLLRVKKLVNLHIECVFTYDRRTDLRRSITHEPHKPRKGGDRERSPIHPNTKKKLNDSCFFGFLCFITVVATNHVLTGHTEWSIHRNVRSIPLSLSATRRQRSVHGQQHTLIVTTNKLDERAIISWIGPIPHQSTHPV